MHLLFKNSLQKSIKNNFIRLFLTNTKSNDLIVNNKRSNESIYCLKVVENVTLGQCFFRICRK